MTTRFISRFDTARDYASQFTVTPVLVSTVIFSLSLLSVGFQRRLFSSPEFLALQPTGADSGRSMPTA
jgi:hypothetical protein